MVSMRVFNHKTRNHCKRIRHRLIQIRLSALQEIKSGASVEPFERATMTSDDENVKTSRQRKVLPRDAKSGRISPNNQDDISSLPPPLSDPNLKTNRESATSAKRRKPLTQVANACINCKKRRTKV